MQRRALALRHMHSCSSVSFVAWAQTLCPLLWYQFAQKLSIDVQEAGSARGVHLVEDTVVAGPIVHDQHAHALVQRICLI